MVFARAPPVLAGTTLLIAAIAPLVATGSPLDPVRRPVRRSSGCCSWAPSRWPWPVSTPARPSAGWVPAARLTVAALVEPTILLAVFALSIPAGSSNLGAIVAHTVDITRNR